MLRATRTCISATDLAPVNEFERADDLRAVGKRDGQAHAIVLDRAGVARGPRGEDLAFLDRATVLDDVFAAAHELTVIGERPSGVDRSVRAIVFERAARLLEV